MSRDKKRTIDPPSIDIEPFHGQKRKGPNQFQGKNLDLSRTSDVQEEARLIDQALIHAKISQDDVLLPGWTTCNQILSNDSHHLSAIGYLPVIDASPTEKSTINAILEKSLIISKQLNLPAIVLVMHQAIYSKAQEIRWYGRSEFRDQLVLRLGEFHTAMAFLGVIGKRFGDAGLRDIAIESNLIAEGSINGVINGHHYNRSVCCHKIISEAMHRLRVQEFLDQLSPDEQEEALSIIHHSLSSFMRSLERESFNDFLQQYEDYVQKRCRENDMYAFWTTYLELVQLLLLFLRGTREGNWDLHLSAIRDMIPWFFAYGRTNYSRYLPIYYLEMKDLPSTHPFVHLHLSNGKFAVKRHDDHGFALTACDQIIEQTFNRDSKTRGGLTGITLNKSAVRRWILSHPARAAIASSCFNMASATSNKQSSKPERIVSQPAMDEKAISDVMVTIQEFSNPFSHEDDRELVNICSGKVAPDDVRTDLFSANTKGEECFKTFVNERLIEGQKDVFDKLSLPTGKTFSDIDKRVPVKATQHAASLKEQRNLLVCLLMIAQENELDLKDIMKYPLSSVPNALADVDGSMAKTNKAMLLHEVEKTFGLSIANTDVILKDNVVVIVDAMVLIQKQHQFPETFGEFADNILRQLLSLARKYRAKRVDFVGDRYREMSIKQAERNRRSMKGETKFLISRPTQKMPNMMRKFLASGSNKENLLMFIVEHWKKLSPEILGDIQLYATQCEACFKFSRSTDGFLTVEDVTDLHSDHEEADTRMLLHSIHASESANEPTDIVICTVDTDVFVLSLWMATLLCQRLAMFFMCGNKSRLMDLKAISTEMGDTIAEALVGLHSFTGCDSVSAFKGKGKVKTLKLMTKNEDYQRIFCELGRNWEVPYPLYTGFEQFVCDLYGWKDSDDVNAVRYKCYRVGNVSDTSLPPNRDSLKLHIDRANYQVKVHRSCAQPYIRALHPKDHGWKLNGSQLSVSWNLLPIAPDSVMTNMYCNCKKTVCNSNRCSCKKAGILCTAVCRCEQCDNRAHPPHDHDSHGGDDSDDSDNDQSN